MILSLKKSLKWFFAITVGLPICTYIVLLVINISEQELSPSSVNKDGVIKSWLNNISDDNAYIYALGFSSETPLVKGRELAQLIIADDTDWSGMVSAKGEYENIALSNSTQLRQTCFRQYKKFCQINTEIESHYFNSNKAKKLVADNKKFIANYQQLITLPTWQEVAIEANINMAYKPLLDGQRLYLMAVLQRLDAVDMQITKDLLEMDIKFWRMTLSETHTLITKVIAKTAIERHFLIVQQVLSKLENNKISALQPDSWLREISNEERDLTNVLIGEWGFHQKYFQKYSAYAESDLFARIQYVALSPLFKTNNSLNLSAQYHDVHANYSKLPYELMQGGALHFEEKLQQHCQSITNTFEVLYNPMGKFISCLGQPSLVEYAVKTSDLEAIRRLALLSFELDIQQYSNEDVKATVMNSEYKNPYTEQAFNFDASKKTLIFVGFQSDDFNSEKVSIAL